MLVDFWVCLSSNSFLTHACIHSPGFIFLLQLRGEVYDQFVNADQVAGVKVW